MPRYIDADNLIADFESVGGEFDVDGIKYIINTYHKLADVVPVVRGEWVLQGENEHDYETSLEEKCSLCGRYVYRYDTQPQDNYCPNCGARMEDT